MENCNGNLKLENCHEFQFSILHYQFQTSYNYFPDFLSSRSITAFKIIGQAIVASQ